MTLILFRKRFSLIIVYYALTSRRSTTQELEEIGKKLDHVEAFMVDVRQVRSSCLRYVLYILTTRLISGQHLNR